MWWSRIRFKEKAKRVLSSSYWMSFLVCLITEIISGGVNFSFSKKLPATSSGTFSYSLFQFFHNPLHLISLLFLSMALLIVAVFVSVIALAFMFFVTYPLTVGKKRFFLMNRKGTTDLSIMFSVFRAGEYLNVVKALAWRWLMNFLWYLCLIIPGIVKYYSYFLVPYLLADNPRLDYKQALHMSEAMTEGHKFDIFVLSLSFIGWYILGLLACGIGILFVLPYYEATFAEMYGALRKNAVEKGIIRAEELNLGEADYAVDA